MRTWDLFEAIAGMLRFVRVGQSAGLTEMGVLIAEVVRMDGAKVGRPCWSKLWTNQKGLIKLVAMTFEFPV